MIDNYNWNASSRLFSHFRLLQYLGRRVRSYSEDVIFEDDGSPDFLQNIKDYDCVVYSAGLGKSFLRLNYTFERLLSDHHYNLIYNSGSLSRIISR